MRSRTLILVAAVLPIFSCHNKTPDSESIDSFEGVVELTEPVWEKNTIDIHPEMHPNIFIPKDSVRFVVGHGSGNSNGFSDTTFHKLHLLWDLPGILKHYDRYMEKIGENVFVSRQDLIDYYRKKPRQSSWNASVEGDGVAIHGILNDKGVSMTWGAGNRAVNEISINVEQLEHGQIGERIKQGNDELKKFIEFTQYLCQKYDAMFVWHNWVSLKATNCPHLLSMNRQIEIANEINSIHSSERIKQGVEELKRYVPNLKIGI